MNSRLSLPVILFAFTALAHAQPLLAAGSQNEQQQISSPPAIGADFDAVIRRFADDGDLEKLAAQLREKAEAKGSDAAAYWLLLGVLADRQDRKDAAIKFCEKAVALAPDNAQASQSLANALLASGRSRDAVDSLQKALANSKTPASRRENYRQLALCQQRASDAGSALKTWRQLIEQFPQDSSVIEEAGDAMADEGRYADASSFYETLRDFKGNSADQQAMAIMKLAQLAEVQYEADKARAFYQSALPLVAADGWIAREIRLRIDDSYRRVDDLPGLAAAWQSYLATHGQDSDAVLHLSEALSQLHRNEEAIAWLRKAAEWTAARKDVKIALAQALRNAGKSREAVEILQSLAVGKAEERDDDERLAGAQWQLFRATQDEASRSAAIETWQRLAPLSEKDPQRVLRVARLLREHGLQDEPLHLYERAADLGSDTPSLRQQWADFLDELKRPEKARDVLRGLVEGPRATPQNFLLLARAQFQRGEVDAAIQSVRAGLEIERKNFELLSLQWTLFAAANQWQEAADLAERLVVAAPSLASGAQVEDNHAHALRKLGKLEEALQRYAQRLVKGAPLSETELRLLAGLALRNGNLDLAGEALADAARRFPDSAELVYDRAELERRRGHIEPSVAAFQRLAELQPVQKEVWLRQITRAYQDENLEESALAAAHRVIDGAPANPDSFALAAGVEFQAHKYDASVANLKEAIRLSERPNALRLQLARTFLYSGRVDDERQTRVMAFDAETDPLARLAMVGNLADVFARSGRLDELIASFRAKRGAEKEGWRYAVYLSEIYRNEQDSMRAKEELAKASGPRSRDLLFLTQCWRISVDAQNGGDRARFARLLAEADPGKAREIELASALLRNSETGEAMKVLQANEESVFGDPMSWHDTLLQAAAAGLGDAIAKMLQSGLARHGDDWRLRFLLSEALMRTGEFDAAEKLLREVEALPVAAAALPPSTMPDANVDRSYEGGMFAGITYSSGTGRAMGSEFARRSLHGYEVRQILAQIAAGLDGVAAIAGAQFTFPNFDRTQPARYLPETPREAADAALIIRSKLAQQQGRGPEFAAALQSALKDQPRSERIAQFALVQALDPLIKEITAESASPSGDEALNAECFEALMTLTAEFSPGMGTVDVDLPSLLPLVTTFLQREKRPETLLLGKLNFSKTLKRVGKDDESREVARDVLSHWQVLPRSHLWQAFDFALQNADFETAEKVLAAITADRQPGSKFSDPSLAAYQINLASAILAKEPNAARAVALLADALRISYSAPSANLSSLSLLRIRSALRLAQEFPYGNRAITLSRTQTWSEVFGIAKKYELLASMKAAIDQQAQTLPPDVGVYARLARICFTWWSDDRDTAIREALSLADTLKGDELHLLAGSMLAEAGHRSDAKKSFDQVSASSGGAGLDKLARLLELARAENDAARAKQIASQLADVPLTPDDRRIMDGVLIELGLAGKAAEIKARERAREEGAFYSGLMGASQKLRQETQAQHKRESIDLARSILDRVSPAANSQSERYYRRLSLDALRQFKGLADYTEELKQQLSETPASAETLLRLAEALERENPDSSADSYRRLLEFNPQDLSIQLRLANLLASSRKLDEAVRVWEMAFARHPEAVFGEGFPTVFYGFQTLKQTSRLGSILLSAPTRGNPLEGLTLRMRDVSHQFDQVAAELRQEGKLDEAIRVWRASLARSRSLRAFAYPEAATLKALVPALLATGRKDEAAQELENYYFPPALPKPALGFEVRSTARNWATLNFGMDGNQDMPGVPMMRLAVEAGALDGLRAKAAAAVAAHPEDPERFLLLLIDVLRYDPANLAALQKAFDETIESSRTPRNPVAAAMLQILAQVLGEWPEGRVLALHVYETSPEFGTTSDGWVKLHRAELALALHESETARKALREWISYKDRISGGLSQVYALEQLTAVDLMSRSGMEADAASLLKKIQATADFPNHPEFRQWVEELGNRLAILAGDSGRAQITVWTAPGVGESRKTRVCWEIGPIASAPVVRRVPALKSSKLMDPPLSVSGQDLPALDGKFTVELFYGATEFALQPIATIPAAKMRGAWESPELGQGYIVACLRDKDVEAYSQKAFIPAAPNLLPNPDLIARTTTAAADSGAVGFPGWPDLNAADLMTLPGGPDAGGHFARLGLLGDASRSAHSLPRVPLEPGRSYYFSGWMRASKDGGRAGLSGRFLDKDGTEIALATPVFTSMPGRWFSCGILLVRSRTARGEEGRIQIPEKAVYFEPQVLSGSSLCEMTSLYFGEIAAESGNPK